MNGAQVHEDKGPIRLKDLARTLRSKNAGPFEVTLDVIFADEATYRHVVASRVVTRESVAQAYRIPLEDVRVLIEFPEGNAIKVTLRRRVPSGSLGDTDVLAAQQHVPLMLLAVPPLVRKPQPEKNSPSG